MDYYQTTFPTVDDSGLSGGVAFSFNGQIASASIRGTFIEPVRSGPPPLQTYTIQICVDGEVKSLDVYVAGDPY